MAENRTTGRFWEGRFTMQRLLNEWAVAACLVYADLSPIRTGITTELSESQHTSIFERLAGVVHAFGKTLTAQQRRDYGLEADSGDGPITLATERTEGQNDSTPTSPTSANTNGNEPSGARKVPLAEDQTAKNQRKVDDRSLSQGSSSQVSEAVRHAGRIRERSMTVPCRRAPQARCLKPSGTRCWRAGALGWPRWRSASSRCGNQCPAPAPRTSAART